MGCSVPGSSVHGDSPGKNTGVGYHTFLQGIFPTQGSNPGLPYYRQILYHLSHQGSPRIWEWVAYPISRDLREQQATRTMHVNHVGHFGEGSGGSSEEIRITASAVPPQACVQQKCAHLCPKQHQGECACSQQGCLETTSENSQRSPNGRVEKSTVAHSGKTTQLWQE